MSRAFIRDQDADGLEDLPDRLISEHPNDVTERGLEQIEASVATARDALAVAQSAGDRSKMARASRDLRYWSARRATARVIPDPDTVSEVRFGSTVTIARDDGRQQTYRIVGEDEADPARGSISHASPLARALFGKGIGDTATLTNGGSRSSASNSHSGLVMARLCTFACWQPRKCYFSAGEMNVRS
jgi:transcription elongation GreA/GreB family factor